MHNAKQVFERATLDLLYADRERETFFITETVPT